MSELSETVLAVMAEDAFEVLNWARRMGMKKDAQLEQLKLAYRKTLSDTQAQIILHEPSAKLEAAE